MSPFANDNSSGMAAWYMYSDRATTWSASGLAGRIRVTYQNVGLVVRRGSSAGRPRLGSCFVFSGLVAELHLLRLHMYSWGVHEALNCRTYWMLLVEQAA